LKISSPILGGEEGWSKIRPALLLHSVHAD
jgi:hypothetical protein